MAADEQETKRLEAAVKSNKEIAESLSKLIAGDARISRFAEASATGMREIAVRATGATSVKLGRTELDQDDLNALRKRAPRSTAEPLHEHGQFRILQADGARSPFKLTLVGDAIPGEFTVEFDDTEFDAAQVAMIWDAFKSRGLVELTVSAILIRENVKGAVLVDIGPSETS